MNEVIDFQKFARPLRWSGAACAALTFIAPTFTALTFTAPTLIAPAGIASADTLAIRRPGEGSSIAPTVYSDVKVTNITRGRIAFTTAAGNTVDKAISAVVALTVDDEPQFNQAQEDYAANHLDRAIDEFTQTIQTTSKPWLKAYCEPLLTDAANKAGRFDVAVQGYVFLVMNEPDQAEAFRPTVPAAGSSFLDPASKTLSDAANAAGIAGPQQAAILSLLLEVDRVRHDTAAIDDVATRLSKLTGQTGGAAANLASLALADAKITEAGAAVTAGDFDKAAALISDNGALFVDPRRQADALYILAHARQGQAQSKNDTGAWQDAALAYMRVAANFKDAPGAPHVANSLVNTAQILDQHLHESGKALKMYQSVAALYPHTPAAEAAAKEIARLQAAGVQPE